MLGKTDILHPLLPGVTLPSLAPVQFANKLAVCTAGCEGLAVALLFEQNTEERVTGFSVYLGSCGVPDV